MSEPSLRDLVTALEEAMQVELGTIPLYLYAYYSIDADPNVEPVAAKAGAEARVAILGIAMQEMLHLALVGNILRSTGTKPIIYQKDRVPTYPSTILKTKIELNLRPADKDNIDSFLQIEAPYYPSPEDLNRLPFHMELLPDSDSIGLHYKKIRYLVQYLENPIRGETGPYQFDSTEFFGSSMYTIYSKAEAYKALELITEQGEGGISVPDSHYAVFVDFYQRQLQWSLLPVVNNPTPDDYGVETLLRYLSDASDAAYCYLLATIETIWKTSRDTSPDKRTTLLRNINPIMSDIVAQLATILVRQPLRDGQNAGPCFAFYSNKEDDQPNTLSELYADIDKHLASAEAHQDARADLKKSIKRIRYALGNIAPPA
ncbi:hypothetical protein AX17_002809 [Amanita inopinata Kibby_2008]|nr:hypothetical protein AX17_002809 [Amanita inopinata Kibby_2008]